MSTELQIKDRETLRMTGVCEVLGFDSDFITAMTSHGKVEIEGEELKILDMSSDTGNLSIVGKINGVYYSSQKEKKGLFSRAAK